MTKKYILNLIVNIMIDFNRFPQLVQASAPVEALRVVNSTPMPDFELLAVETAEPMKAGKFYNVSISYSANMFEIEYGLYRLPYTMDGETR